LSVKVAPVHAPSPGRAAWETLIAADGHKPSAAFSFPKISKNKKMPLSPENLAEVGGALAVRLTERQILKMSLSAGFQAERAHTR